MGELKQLFMPLAKLLAKARAGRTFYTERECRAWKMGAKGDVEDAAFQQMANACRLPIAVGGALMPDAHTGYGLPIGGVAVRNAVIPYAVGVDIACRMRITILIFLTKSLRPSPTVSPRRSSKPKPVSGSGRSFRKASAVTTP